MRGCTPTPAASRALPNLRALPALPALPALLALLALLAQGCVDNTTPWAPPAPAKTPLACTPIRDGRITSAELAAAPGATGRYSVGVGPADVAGTIDPAGRRVWDWRTPPATATEQGFAVQDATTAWYRVPGAQFALPLDTTGALLGVYRRDDEALWLLALVSSEADPPGGRTELVYTSPVAVLRFPLAVGAAWTSVGSVVKGTLNGLPYNGTDTYDVRVDGSGTLQLPWLEASPALRVTTRVQVAASGVAPLVRHQASWLFPCVGELARVSAQDDGAGEGDWANPTEVRQLVP